MCKTAFHCTTKLDSYSIDLDGPAMVMAVIRPSASDESKQSVSTYTLDDFVWLQQMGGSCPCALEMLPSKDACTIK